MKNILKVASLFMLTTIAFAGEEKAKIKVACVGDSITFGFGIKQRETKSYPSQLGEMLGKGYEVKNFGVSGKTVLKKSSKNNSYSKTKQFKAALEYRPNVVIIKLGTNDAKFRNWKHKEEFVQDYVELIGKFQALDPKPTIWICHPIRAFYRKYGIDPVVLRKEVTPMIDIVAKKANVKVIDLYDALKDMPKLVPDKIHPNAEGAKVIAKTVCAVITGTSNRPK